MEIAPNIHCIKNMANVYALVDGDDVTLIDTALPSLDRVDVIFNYLERLDLFPDNLKRILLTHADADHAGNVAGILAETRATVWATAEAKEQMVKGKPPEHVPAVFVWVGNLFAPLPPVTAERIEVFNPENRMLPILGGLELISTPGHTRDHVSFYHPQTGVLFAGDALFALGGRLRVGPDMLTADPAAGRRAALDLLKRSPTVFACGHGAPIMDAKMDDLLALQRQLEG